MIVTAERFERLRAQGERSEGLTAEEHQWAGMAIVNLVYMFDEGQVQWPDESLVRGWCSRGVAPGRVETVAAFVVGAVDLEMNP